MNATWFFDGWEVLARTAVVGVGAYVALVGLLRVSGKRTLAKLNAFDLVVTVALGSTLSSVLTSSGVALAQGVTAFVVLVALQFVVAWASVRAPRVRDAVRSEPTLLLRHGVPLDAALRRERITRSELDAAIRAQGTARLEAVDAVILETDGSLSVVTGEDRTAGRSSALPNLQPRDAGSNGA